MQKLAALKDEFSIIAAGRNQAKLDEAIAQLPDASNVTTLIVDVTSEESINAAAAKVKAAHGHLDVLVNNAGIEFVSEDVSRSFKTVFATNLFGPVLMSAAFRPLLLAAKKPQSVYVSSIVGRLSAISTEGEFLRALQRGSPAYRSSKSALNMVVLHEQLEVADTELKVYAMCPGFVISNLRGTSEEARTGGGRALSADTSAELLYKILKGEKDGEMTKLITNDGPKDW